MTPIDHMSEPGNTGSNRNISGAKSKKGIKFFVNDFDEKKGGNKYFIICF